MMNKAWLWRLTTKPEVRFLIVGTTGYTANLIVLILLVAVVGIEVEISNLIALIVSVELVFVLDNFWTFSHRPAGSGRVLVSRFLKHHLQRAFSVALEQIVFTWLVGVGVFYLLANATVVVLAAAINLVAAKKLTFT